ncbi:hypothetical protein TSOC_010536, partial [Tetrabaena socialis]
LEERLLAQKVEVEGLKSKLEGRDQQMAQVTFERDTLLRNISCLFNTAKEEMARKQLEINNLRTELAQAKQQLPPPPPLPHCSRASLGVLPNGMAPAQFEQQHMQRGLPRPLPPRAPLPPAGGRSHQPAQLAGMSGGPGKAAARAGSGSTGSKRGREGSSDREEQRSSDHDGGRDRGGLKETGGSKRQRSMEGWADPARVPSGPSDSAVS